jgi:hypothetical protein
MCWQLQIDESLESMEGLCIVLMSVKLLTSSLAQVRLYCERLGKRAPGWANALQAGQMRSRLGICALGHTNANFVIFSRAANNVNPLINTNFLLSRNLPTAGVIRGCRLGDYVYLIVAFIS